MLGNSLRVSYKATKQFCDHLGKARVFKSAPPPEPADAKIKGPP